MNVFMNGLKQELRSHVVLSQPTSFTEAEKLAHPREAVTSTSEVNSVTASSPTVHEQRIKELEGQVKLLLSLASNEKSSKPPSLISITSDMLRSLLHDVPPPLESQGGYLAIGSRSEIHQVKADIIAAIHNSAQNNVRLCVPLQNPSTQSDYTQSLSKAIQIANQTVQKNLLTARHKQTSQYAQGHPAWKPFAAGQTLWLSRPKKWKFGKKWPIQNQQPKWGQLCITVHHREKSCSTS